MYGKASFTRPLTSKESEYVGLLACKPCYNRIYWELTGEKRRTQRKNTSASEPLPPLPLAPIFQRAPAASQGENEFRAVLETLSRVVEGLDAKDLEVKQGVLAGAVEEVFARELGKKRKLELSNNLDTMRKRRAELEDQLKALHNTMSTVENQLEHMNSAS